MGGIVVFDIGMMDLKGKILMLLLFRFTTSGIPFVQLTTYIYGVTVPVTIIIFKICSTSL